VTLLWCRIDINGKYLAIENQQAIIKDVIEVKTGVYLHKI
jgi:hypothetical protein